MCCRPDDLALIELVSLVTGNAILPLSRGCILSSATDRVAPRFTLLLALPLAVVDACRKRGWWLAGPRWLVAALICDRQLLLDGVLGCISVLAVALVLALGHLVLIVPR